MSHLWRQIDGWQRAIAHYLLAHQPQITAADLNQQVRALIYVGLTLLIYEQQRHEQQCHWTQTGLSHPCTTQASQPLTMREGDRLSDWLTRLPNQYHTLIPADWRILCETIAADLSLPSLLSEAQHHRSERSLTTAILAQTHEYLLAKPLHITSDRQTVPAPQSTAKKSRGVYYTPQAIAEFIVHQTVGVCLTKQSTQSQVYPALQILDPACGGGIFLHITYQVLLNQCLQYDIAQNLTKHLQLNPTGDYELTWARRSQILLDCIYGVDIDPQAVAVTRISLHLQLLTGSTTNPPNSLPDLSHNIQCGNTLIDTDNNFPPSSNLSIPYSLLPTPYSLPPTPPLNWETAFPFISQSFDVVLGNPPYIDAETMTTHLPHWRSYCTQHYRTAVGNWDLFCVFIEKALALCKPNGLNSFVVPNKLISANYAAEVRSLIMQDHQLLSIRDYSQVSLFQAAVYPVVYIAQKTIPTAIATIHYELMQSLETVAASCHLPYAQYLENPRHPWLLPSHPHIPDLMARLQQTFPPLETLAEVSGAATVSEAYALQTWIQDRAVPKNSDLQLVNSGTIDRYQLLWGIKPLRYLGKTYLHPILAQEYKNRLSPRRQRQATHPKIIVSGLSQHLECAVDLTGSMLAGKSTSVILTQIDLRYLLGLLNSRLLNLYFFNQFRGNCLQGGYLRVGPPQLRQLPIALPNLSYPKDTDSPPHPCNSTAKNTGNDEELTYEQRSYDQVIDWVEQRLLLQHHCRGRSMTTEQKAIQQQMNMIDRQINTLTYQLYGLTDAEIALLEMSHTH